MRARVRAAVGLPAAAIVLVAAVLGVQLAAGGGSYEPLRPVDACVPRVATPQTTLDGLTAELVLLGIANAACDLHVTREDLTLELAGSASPSDAQVDALHDGLLQAVKQMDAAKALPAPSDLVGPAVDASNLNGFVKFALKAVPDSVVDASLQTDDVLTRTIDDLDLRTVLADLGDRDSLNAEIGGAVQKAVIAALIARLKALV